MARQQNFVRNNEYSQKSEGLALDVCKLCDYSENLVYYICFVVYIRCVSSSFLFEFQNWLLDLWADVKLIAGEVDNQIVCGQFVCFLF